MARKDTGSRTGTSRGGARRAGEARGQQQTVPQTVGATPIAARLGDEDAKAGAELLRALADPTRLQILDVLRAGGGEISVRELEGAVGLPDPRTGRRPLQPTISHHLKILRIAGLVGFRRRGPWIHYYVRGERIAAVRSLLDTLA